MAAKKKGLFLRFPATKVVIKDILRRNAQIVKHIDHSGTHRARAAHIVFDVLGRGMVFQIDFVHHIVHKTSGILHALGIGGRVGTVKGEMEMEVRKILFKLQEII